MAADQSLGLTSEPAISKAEFARQIAERSLDELAQQLDAGESAQLAAYLAAMGRFHQYSFNNLMLILTQCPSATRVAGFHTWRSMGRTVKRGEKGIAIFAPMRIKPKAANADDTEEKKDARPVLRFRVVHVFDVSQTEGEALPEPPRVGGHPGPWLQRLERAITESGITLEESLRLPGALGVSTGGKILIKPGLAPAEHFSVLVHEWAHEMLHHVAADARPNKTVRELEAEAVAFVVNSAVGLNTGTASSDYIRLYNGDAATLAASLDRIQRTSNNIIEALHPELSKARRVDMVIDHAAKSQSRSR